MSTCIETIRPGDKISAAGLSHKCVRFREDFKARQGSPPATPVGACRDAAVEEGQLRRLHLQASVQPGGARSGPRLLLVALVVLVLHLVLAVLVVLVVLVEALSEVSTRLVSPSGGRPRRRSHTGCGPRYPCHFGARRGASGRSSSSPRAGSRRGVYLLHRPAPGATSSGCWRQRSARKRSISTTLASRESGKYRSSTMTGCESPSLSTSSRAGAVGAVRRM
jgi:hypothetical protein